MKTLTTLGINNWPYYQTGFRTPNPIPTYQDSYRYSLAVLATQIADIRHQRYLSVLADNVTANAGHCCDNPTPVLRMVSFGICEKYINQENWGYGLKPMCFVKSRVHMMGSQIKWKMEPVTGDCLDYDYTSERDEYDIDLLAHDVGQFEFGLW